MVAHEADPPMPLLEQMPGRERAARHVVDHDPREARVRDVEQHGRQLVVGERLDLVVEHRQRHDQQPGDAVATRQVAHRVGPLFGRLDIEEQKVIACAFMAAQPGDHAAHALDHRVGGEERHDHAHRLRPPDRQGARRGVEPVAELVDRGPDAGTRLVHHERAVVEHPRDRRRTHAGPAGNIPDRRTTTPR